MAATAAALSSRDYAKRAMARYWWRVARAREYFPEFAELVVKDNLGQPIRMWPHHLAWIWHVTYCWNRGMHAAIWAPFGAGKSAIFTSLLAWLVGRNPQVRIKVVCNIDQMAGARVMGAKGILEAAEYRDVFPGVRPGKRWNVKEAFVQRRGSAMDPTLHARGVNTPGTGTRADTIMFDDVVDHDNSQEFLQRKRVKEAVHKKWMSRLDPERGRVLWISTPYHVDDASHDLLAMPNWCTLIQRVAPDLQGQFEQTVHGSAPDYPQVVGAMQANHDRVQAEMALP